MAIAPPLPTPRGPYSAAVIDALTGPATSITLPTAPVDDVLADDDLQLALWCCYELHYQSFAGVDPEWEWDPGLLGVRRRLEARMLDRLREIVGSVEIPPRDVPDALRALATDDTGAPSLSRYMARDGTRAELCEFLVHRSAYQRKEADPHTWAIPRLRGRAKAAMVAIQHDEYGAGEADAMHAELFATTMATFGLDPRYGAYVDLLPGTTLATDNLVSLFGLHRSLRFACVGHLALFEMTSVGPMGRYSAAVRRLGGGPAARAFYDVHVAADAVHEVVAIDQMVTGLLTDEPDGAGLVVFGARALAEVERRFASRLLDRWRGGEPSLLAPLAPEQLAS
ncbi:MAG: iron-containing redox enzyme family protein [Acidimicrobiia bacterium]